MKREYAGKKFFCAVISHKRPENIPHIFATVGPCTFYVNEGERKAYLECLISFKIRNCEVKECHSNICHARNQAIVDASRLKLPCIQVSDDLKGIKQVALLANGKRIQNDIKFEQAVDILLGEMERTCFLYGGVAVSSNALNYNGTNFSYDKLIVNDLICIRSGSVGRNMIKHEAPLFDENIPLKEDYDMSLGQLINCGGVVRCDSILCNFPHRENKGGANTYRTPKEEAAMTLRLKKKWGAFIKDNPKRPGQVLLNYPLLRKAISELRNRQRQKH